MKKNILFLLFSLLAINVFSQTLTTSNLPIFIIGTADGRTILNEPKILADLKIIDNGTGKTNNVTDAPKGYTGKIGIELRGSTSQDFFPKKPYGFETWDDKQLDVKVSVLGFPEESDWILNATYNDKTLMRDPLAYWLARQSGRYATRTKHVEVILNGQYQGIYILQEKIKRDKNRVDIAKLEANESTGDALTGGYIVKIDKTSGGVSRSWYSDFKPDPRSSAKPYFQVEYPKIENLTDPQFNYIRSYVNAFEVAINGSDFKDPDKGYRKYINVDSFVDYLLLTELTRNVDGYRLSTYFSKDKDSKGGKLTMGPAWDYNIALGNGNYYDGYKTQGWQYNVNEFMYNPPNDDTFKTPNWWKQLMEDFSFSQKAYERWRGLRAKAWSNATINKFIDSTATVLNESQVRNFQKWPVLGRNIWPNYYVGATYTEEVNWMKNWISQRLTWLDTQFADKGILTATETPQASFEALKVYPNPLETESVIEYQIPNDARVSLKLYDVLGNPSQILIENEAQKAGKYQFGWNSGSLSRGVYVLDFQTDNVSMGRKKLIKQ